MSTRVFLIVMDSFGIGYAADADEYGDVGSNTLASVYKNPRFCAPNLAKLGLFNIDGVSVGEKQQNPIASFAKMQELSVGKDTTFGHWEIAGVINKKPMPLYPNGFSQSIIEKIKAATGRGVLCNKQYSGTQVILDYGEEHIRTGDLIVYTSADSVLQIAAHESVIAVDELYEVCQKVREIMQGDDAVGRIIARPFVGRYPDFVRTANRKDFCLPAPKDTILDVLSREGLDTKAVGKISDIFSGRGIDESVHIENNAEGMDVTINYLDKRFDGLCFVNLVDFDSIYGHRNNVDGYAAAVSEFDVRLGEFLEEMSQNDILFITADHGCDPCFKGTNHTREYTPMLVYGKKIKNGVNLGTRRGFCDIGKTICDVFGVKNDLDGVSFWDEVKADD